MEKYCVSLEIAKQLKEEGWKKETEFAWGKDIRYQFDGEYGLVNTSQYILTSAKDNWEEYFSAPLATEILEELNDSQMHLYLMQRYGIATAQSCLDMIRDINEIAKCWLYLKKNNLLEDK